MEAETPAYDVTTPLKKDIELERRYVAQIHAIQHIEMRALERGYLDDIYVDEGEQVEDRQLMFQIMPLIYQAEVRKSKAEVDLATIEYKNTKLLSDRDIVSPTELRLAKAKLERAKAELSLAETHKRLTEIHAPFEGIMGRFRVRKGSLVEEGELLTTLADVSTVWVYFNVTEAEYLDYKMELREKGHEPVKLLMANGKEFPEPGAIETIEADFNNETGNIAFRAAFPNPRGLLRHGETGTVVRVKQYPDAILVPQKATYELLDRRYVFVVDDDGVVHSRQISIAAQLPHLFVVSGGVDETDHILLEGLRRVHDGSRIEVKLRDPAEVYEQLEPPAE